jgi:hypothetical protein
MVNLPTIVLGVTQPAMPRVLLSAIRLERGAQLFGQRCGQGMEAGVRFHVAPADRPWLVPSIAIIIVSGPLRIAVVRADGVASASSTGAFVPAGDLQDGARVHLVPGPA